MATGIFKLRDQIQGLVQKAWIGTIASTYQGNFNGSSQYLTAPSNAAFGFNSSNFTIEFWINSVSTTNSRIFGNGSGGAWSANNWVVGFNAPNVGQVTWSQNNSSFIVNSSTNINNGAWHHIAVVRNGNTFTIYVDGTSNATGTYSGSVDGGGSWPFVVGFSGISGDVSFAGALSNVRVVKGTAVYTSTFTPPTAPLTAISGTSLLTLQNATIIDNSSNAFTITNTGTTTTSIAYPFSPVNTSAPAVEYLVVAGGGGGGGGGGGDAAGGGAGGLLQGILPITTGSSITVTVGAAGTAGTGSANGGQGGDSVFSNITATGGGAGGGISTTTSGGGSGGGNIYPENTRSFGIVGQGNAGGLTNTGDRSGGSAPGGGGAGTVGLNTTSTSSGNGGAGIASAISGTVTAYAGGGGGGTYASQTAGVGGVGGGGNGGQASPSTSATAGATNTGGGGGGGKNGVSGAAGGSGIVIISYPDTYNAPTALTGIYTASTSGSGSVQFNGSNSIKYGPNSAINLGSSNFTIEGWFYPTAAGGFLAQRQAGSASGWAIGGGTSGALIGGVWYPDFGTGTVYLNSWQHNAWVRSGTTMYFFINGVLVRTTTGVTGAVDVWAQPMNMGSSSSDGTEGRLTGYVSNARIVSGTALYTSTFTPSTAPLTPISGTLFLNNAVSGSPFFDTSTNYFTPTFAGSGNPTWNQSSPFATGLGYKNRVYTWTGSGTVTF